ncbi:hypothetical protein fHeYen902_005c [Yersinia phage fHe-Yen9-02]|nr:hypothetical protein fHeYen902_005c [Yersinia phage fHe-Yen9-02]
MRLNLFATLSRDRQEKVLKQICHDSAYIPQFEQRFRTMTLFSVRKALGLKTDIFSYLPKADQQIAVGYRIQYVGGRFLAEPWAWIVNDNLKSVGTEITDLLQNAIYFGTTVPVAMIAQYGSQAYSLLLGNLRMLQKLSYSPISY